MEDPQGTAVRDSAEGQIPARGWALLWAIALVSFSLMAYEIALSRLLSVLLSYHFAFAVLSLALLGLGLGGLLLHILEKRATNRSRMPGRLIHLGVASSVGIPISALLAIGLSNIPSLGGDVLWYLPPLIVPFVFGGAFLAEVYRSFPDLSARTYGADLMGAAAGAPGAILLLDALGGEGVPLVLGTLASIGVLFLINHLKEAETRKRSGRYAWTSLILCACLAAAHCLGLVPLEVSLKANPGKEIHEALSTFRGRIVESRWSSFGRTDLVAYEEYPNHMDIYLDGTAGSPMYRFEGQVGNPHPWLRALQEEFPGYFPLLHLAENERDSALIIGPGGGRDVLLALLAGVRSIEAVEINADLVRMVRERSWFNGGIYNDFKNVQIKVDEGRSYLRRQGRNYDIIFLSLPVTNTSRSIEGYSLTENYLFTIESVGDYWDHLTEEGRLVVVAHNDVELLRLIAISVRTLAKRGIQIPSSMTRICVVSSGDYLAFVLKKTPFQPANSMSAYSALIKGGYKLSESYLPFLPAGAGLNPALAALGSGRMSLEDLMEMVARKGYDIHPVSDDNPFFYRTELGIPGSVLTVLWASLGVFLTACAFFFLRFQQVACPPRLKRDRNPGRGLGLPRAVLLFSMLGVGFMCIEICLIQRFTLLLGQPVWTMGIVIFSMLLSAGAGSLFAGKWSNGFLQRRIAGTCLFIGLMILAYGSFLPALLHVFKGWPTAARVGAIVLGTAPVGFFMGIPFPLGIRAVSQEHTGSVIPWMWAFNGTASVIGSSLTIVLALELGFTTALLAAAFSYFIISAALFKP